MKPVNPIMSVNDKRTIFFKVFNAANYRSGYEYQDGYNDLSKYLDLEGNPYTCYFTDIEHIFAYLNYGPCYREIIVPEDAELHSSTDIMSINPIPEWNSNKVKLGDVKIFNLANIKDLISKGADISVENYYIVEWALMRNFEVFYFLQDYIYDFSPEIWQRILEDLQFRGFL